MLLLLTARLEVAANRRLGDAATGARVTLRVVDASRVGAMAGSKPRLWLDGEDLLEQDPSAVLARVGNWRPDSVLAALETALAAGVPTPNPPASIRLGRDHWLTIRHLAAAGLAANLLSSPKQTAIAPGQVLPVRFTEHWRFNQP